ncbi:MAG: hypothetical protein KKA05_03955 [Alphaproteobacteria bacterium]|nr:hypothetical protein [Alphaproteobacteria bacterium]MBU0859048.1 hypothetical protein [Alphaproteobacteria bacterium]
MNKIPAVLAIALMINCAAPMAMAQDKQRNNFLLRFFDMNEGAALYNRYCMKKDDASLGRFKANHDRVGQALLNELIRQSPETSPQVVRATLKERQQGLHYQLESFYMQNRCTHPEAIQAKVHYETLAAVSESQLDEYIAGEMPIAH